MGLLTIGAFARAARLSPKALRIYDRLGLLPPARVDPVTGYRFYDPEQLGRARLVAWLRRLDMPLARIRIVCGLEPAEAAAEIAAYWARVESHTAARRQLAALLIDQLSGKGAEHMGIRCAMRTDIGRFREKNQDSGYAGARLLAVADGFGGHGESASAAAVEALAPLDSEEFGEGLLNALDKAVHDIDSALREMTRSDPSLEGMGTTLTALLWSGTRLGLVHVGDSRAYLLRDGRFARMTDDHTYVRALVDEGRLAPEEAAAHPKHSLLPHALQGGGVAADLKLRDARPGDRYLLCSDGLSAVVPDSTVHEALATTSDPEQAVAGLIDLAIGEGGPDNVTCVVADVLDLHAA